MKQKYIKYGLIALTLTGCSVDQLENETASTPQEEVMITATINNHELASRIVFEENGSTTNVNWEKGDGITLFSAEQNNLHYTATNASTEEDFQFVTTTNEVLKNLEGQKVYACYPQSDNELSNISLPATHLFDYNDNADNKIYCPFLYGRGIIQEERLDLNFSHLFGYLKLVINQDALPFNETDKSMDIVSLSVSDDEPLGIMSGTFDLKSQIPTYTDVTNEVNVKYSHDLSNGELSFYVPVLPQSNDKWDRAMHFSILREKDNGEKEILYRMNPILPTEGIKKGHMYIVNFPGVSFESNYINISITDITTNGATITATLTDKYYHEAPSKYEISVMDASSGQMVDVSETVRVNEKTYSCTTDGLAPNKVYIAYMIITYTRNEAIVWDETTMNSITFRSLE